MMSNKLLNYSESVLKFHYKQLCVKNKISHRPIMFLFFDVVFHWNWKSFFIHFFNNLYHLVAEQLEKI